MRPPSRCIRLRRPAAIVRSSGRFVPEGISLAEVEEAWALARSRNPRLFDGPLLHVPGVSRNGHGGVTVHAIESSYRFHAVRSVGVETGIRPLGVKAIAWREGRVLVGLRSASVHAEPRRWEFVPGGTLEPGRDPAEQLESELHEEAGWRSLSPPRQIALLFDDASNSWEIIHELDAEPADRRGGGVERWEHDELREIRPERVGALPLTRAAALMVPLLRSRTTRASAHPAP